MTTINKRTMVNLSAETKLALEELSTENNTSLSKTAADLIAFALNVREDVYLDELATSRLADTFKTISHDDIWA